MFIESKVMLRKNATQANSRANPRNNSRETEEAQYLLVHGPYGTMYLYNTYVTVLTAGWFRWQSCDVTVTCSSLSTSVSWVVTKCSPARLGHTGSLADRRSTESRCCLENSPYRPTNMPLEGPRFSSELVKRYAGNLLKL